MKRRKITDIAIEVLKEEKAIHIGYNEFGMLDDVFDRALKEGIVANVGSRGGKRNSHPLNNQQVVLNALDRDERFEKFYIKLHNSAGKQCIVREFRLKEEL